MDLMHIFTGPGGYAGSVKSRYDTAVQKENLYNLHNSYSRILCVMTSF